MVFKTELMKRGPENWRFHSPGVSGRFPCVRMGKLRPGEPDSTHVTAPGRD